MTANRPSKVVVNGHQSSKVVMTTGNCVKTVVGQFPVRVFSGVGLECERSSLNFGHDVSVPESGILYLMGASGVASSSAPVVMVGSRRLVGVSFSADAAGPGYIVEVVTSDSDGLVPPDNVIASFELDGAEAGEGFAYCNVFNVVIPAKTRVAVRVTGPQNTTSPWKHCVARLDLACEDIGVGSVGGGGGVSDHSALTSLDADDHPQYLTVDRRDQIEGPRVFVSKSIGSDLTGDGTRGNPYQTIQKGIEAAKALEVVLGEREKLISVDPGDGSFTDSAYFENLRINCKNLVFEGRWDNHPHRVVSTIWSWSAFSTGDEPPVFVSNMSDAEMVAYSNTEGGATWDESNGYEYTGPSLLNRDSVDDDGGNINDASDGSFQADMNITFRKFGFATVADNWGAENICFAAVFAPETNGNLLVQAAKIRLEDVQLQGAEPTIFIKNVTGFELGPGNFGTVPHSNYLVLDNSVRTRPEERLFANTILSFDESDPNGSPVPAIFFGETTSRYVLHDMTVDGRFIIAGHNSATKNELADTREIHTHGGIEIFAPFEFAGALNDSVYLRRVTSKLDVKFHAGVAVAIDDLNCNDLFRFVTDSVWDPGQTVVSGDLVKSSGGDFFFATSGGVTAGNDSDLSSGSDTGVSWESFGDSEFFRINELMVRNDATFHVGDSEICHGKVYGDLFIEGDSVVTFNGTVLGNVFISQNATLKTKSLVVSGRVSNQGDIDAEQLYVSNGVTLSDSATISKWVGGNVDGMTYDPNSLLGHLSSPIRGSVLVRDYQPHEINPNVCCWYDVSELGQANGTTVAALPDLAGAIDLTAVGSPTYVTGPDFDYVSFDGIGDYFFDALNLSQERMARMFGADKFAGFTMASVIRLPVAPAFLWLWSNGTTTGTGIYRIGLANGMTWDVEITWDGVRRVNEASSQTLSVNQWHVVTHRFTPRPDLDAAGNGTYLYVLDNDFGGADFDVYPQHIPPSTVPAFRALTLGQRAGVVAGFTQFDFAAGGFWFNQWDDDRIAFNIEKLKSRFLP